MNPSRGTLVGLLLGAAMPALADQVVTLRVPVALQNLHPQVAKLSVGCYLTPVGAFARTDLPVANRAFNGTVEIKVKVTDGESLSATGYKCSLFLFPASGSGQAPTQDLTAATPMYHAKPGTPFKREVEGPLPAAETASGPKTAVTPAWGAVGAAPPAPGPAVPALGQRGGAKSALPGAAQKP